MSTITLPSSLAQAYEDVFCAPGYPASSLPVDHKELTADHLDDLRHAALHTQLRGGTDGTHPDR